MRRSGRFSPPMGADRSSRTGLADLVVDVAVPVALYYVLRAAGASVYLALLVGAVVPAVSSVIKAVRRRTLDRLGVFMLSTMLAGVVVALIAGSPRFLLAKDGWVTAAVGIWFLISSRGSRPMAFVFARAAMEGRGPFKTSWATLWDTSAPFRRSWRISSLIWGVGLLIDAVVRVIMAYTLPVDLVPALSTALLPVTVVILVGLDQINQRQAGLRHMLVGKS